MAAKWYCRVMGTEMGPLTSKELLQMAREHQISPDDSVRKGPDGKWARAERVKGLFDDPGMSTIIMSNLPPEMRPAETNSQPKTASPAPHEPASETWHYISEQGKVGPLSFDQLVAHSAHGNLKPSDRVWSTKSPKWCEAKKVKGLKFQS